MNQPIVWILCLALVTACSLPPSERRVTALSIEPLVANNPAPNEFAGCTFASPLLDPNPDGDAAIIVVGGRGKLAALSPATAEELWSLQLPAPNGERAVVAATPVRVARRLVVAYHTSQSGSLNDAARLRQRVAVVELDRRQLDAALPVLELAASLPATDIAGAKVPFLPDHALARGQLVHMPGEAPGSVGRVYVTFGNARDIQPWHGWIFELDLDAWLGDGAGAAVTAVMTTTPISDCGPEGASGSRERRCGGGLWAPSGPLRVSSGQRDALVLSPGNGQLDLALEAYANTLMRVEPGLEFDPDCDTQACANFDPDQPSEACSRSCRNLFIPRMPAGQSPPRPESGACEGMPFFECWQTLDYIGGSTPAFAQLGQRRLLVYPTKDGAAYLVDADHLGRQYDRLQMVAYCGTPEDRCLWDWAGMAVTQPEVLNISGRPVAIIPTFMPDKTHPAGVVALNVIEHEGEPQLEQRWTYPEFTEEQARTTFRKHPTRPALGVHEGRRLVWLVDVGGSPNAHRRGQLLGIDADDGSLAASIELSGTGRRFTRPLVVGDKIFVNSCAQDNDGPGTIEAYRIRANTTTRLRRSE